MASVTDLCKNKDGQEFALPPELKFHCMQCYNWDEDFTDKALIGYRQLMKIKLNHEDWEDDMLCASDVVDKVWKLHVLLGVKTYTKACQDYTGGYLIDYSSVETLTAETLQTRIQSTEFSLTALFGVHWIDSTVWSFAFDITEPLATSNMEDETAANRTVTPCKETLFDFPNINDEEGLDPLEEYLDPLEDNEVVEPTIQQQPSKKRKHDNAGGEIDTDSHTNSHNINTPLAQSTNVAIQVFHSLVKQGEISVFQKNHQTFEAFFVDPQTPMSEIATKLEQSYNLPKNSIGLNDHGQDLILNSGCAPKACDVKSPCALEIHHHNLVQLVHLGAYWDLWSGKEEKVSTWLPVAQDTPMDDILATFCKLKGLPNHSLNHKEEETDILGKPTKLLWYWDKDEIETTFSFVNRYDVYDEETLSFPKDDSLKKAFDAFKEKHGIRSCKFWFDGKPIASKKKLASLGTYRPHFEVTYQVWEKN